MKALPLPEIDLLFIEHIGNLICPVEFQLGEKVRIVVASIPEGDNKPYKYPGIFTAVSAVVLNKIDSAVYVDFNLEAMRKAVRRFNPGTRSLSSPAGQAKAFPSGQNGWSPSGGPREAEDREFECMSPPPIHPFISPLGPH